MALKRLLSSARPFIIGMVHVQALPGTPLNRLSISEIISIACQEAKLYKHTGIDAIMIENMHDIPYVQASLLGPEVVAAMTAVCSQVKRECGHMPVGVQVLAQGNREALAVALAAGLDFIRAECYVFSHVADEGLMNASAGELLRYRRNIGAQHVAVIADIKKKHSAHAITADISLEETAKAAECFLADGVVVTGVATGCPASPAEVVAVKTSVEIPVLVGSGVTLENVNDYVAADGLIIGSYFKIGGNWTGPVDGEKVRTFMDKVNGLRHSRS